MKVKKIPAITQARTLIAAMNGEPFTHHLLKDVPRGSSALAQLSEGTGYGEIKVVGRKKIAGFRECNLYKATGKPAPVSMRSPTYNKSVEEWPLLGGKSISDYPKAAVTIHRIGW